MIKKGIALIGNTIVDELVPILEPGQLSYVDANKFVSEEELKGEKIKFSVGGMALNVGVDLAKIGGSYPVGVFGKVGRDHQAELIHESLQMNHLDSGHLIVDENNETSRTEVLHFKLHDGKIERVFRHVLGAMGSFDENEVQIEKIAQYKIAMLGYGLLLPKFDFEDEKYGTKTGKVLSNLQKLGVQTCIDFISPSKENLFKFYRYRKTIKYVDICCINEDQADALTGLQKPEQACKALVDKLGAKVAIVHCGAEGPNYAYTKQDGLLIQQNFKIAEKDYKGNAGAGDAFTSGILHGIHEGWALDDALKFASAAAAISLRDISCTGAMQSEQFILEFINANL